MELPDLAREIGLGVRKNEKNVRKKIVARPVISGIMEGDL